IANCVAPGIALAHAIGRIGCLFAGCCHGQATKAWYGIMMHGNDGYQKALSEIYRTLKVGGRLYAIENEWANIAQILELFKSNNKQPWDCFIQQSKKWEELFVECGFNILYNEIFEERKLTGKDNELGEMAEKDHVDIWLKFSGFILEKR
ncbi:MAG: prolipoprotein diacylglyceryl transferase, partial [Paludibacteraceae bacterium]|nr:prolipoprotein diacylglyceryl transferase [Paludibacteraceae bacterium]